MAPGRATGDPPSAERPPGYGREVGGGADPAVVDMSADETVAAGPGGAAARTRASADVARITERLVDSVGDYAIFGLDPDGIVRSWNRGARRLKGYTAEQIVGRHFSVFYTEPERVAGLPGALLVRAEQDGSVEHVGWRVRRDGSTFWAQVTITALRDDDGELIGFAKVTRDRSAEHEDEEALRRALAREREGAAELERFHQFRTHFLASIAHDLSTPATVIAAAADLLDADDFPDREVRTELLDHVRRNARTLDELAQQLREFARLESGKVELRRESIGLRAIVEEVAGDLGLVHGEVALDVDVPGDARVIADRLGVHRILCNLLANAVSFTPAGSSVKVRTRHVGGVLACGVLDAGPGIAVDERAAVFEEFWQGHQGGRRSGRGLGLGLNIVAQYVQEHGGRVWVEGADDGGAAFWFTLGPPPAAPPE
ncbi:PAS domain-containing sensor histidine kinase [Nitriliruptoraceae bacterium ZYF776]|nr:PAS domain-containing sensor histidine kinase [Profundirhabdus halotolerans]